MLNVHEVERDDKLIDIILKSTIFVKVKLWEEFL